jgi:uncharacterized alkaline shock family protein YloU
VSRVLAPGVSISDSAFQRLVVRAVEQVEGARLRKPRKNVEIAGGRLELALAARYGAVLPELARDVQQNVSETIATMCGLRLDGVDVTIEELDR